MRRLEKIRLLYVLSALCGVLALSMLPGCSDDPVLPDTTAKDTSPTPDTVPNPDNMWPDITPPVDQSPDQYKGSKFGCKDDMDCFGKKCCPTPWGVKLCAPTCEIKK